MIKRMLSRWLAFLFLFLSVFAAAAPVPASAGEQVVPEGTFELLPGVVLDRSHPAIYLMRPDQGIDAVDPASGALLWSSREAAKPLLVYGDLLVAQTEPDRADNLGIAFLSRSDGTVRLAMDVPLPEGVTGSVANGLGTQFDVWAVVRQGRISIGWESVKRWVKPIPPRQRDALETRLKGGVLIDLLAKTTTRIAAPPRPVLPRPRLAMDDAPTGEGVRTDGVFATTHMVRNAGSQRLVLQRWSTGTGALLEEVTLFAGDYHLRLPSADGQHLMVSREATRSGPDGYTLLIFSLASGKLLGKIESQRSHAFFYVLGSTLFYESLPFFHRAVDGDDEIVFESRKLCAVDLANDAVLWERPVRDITYRGPYPP
jgi:hypothetical protein